MIGDRIRLCRAHMVKKEQSTDIQVNSHSRDEQGGNFVQSDEFSDNSAVASG